MLDAPVLLLENLKHCSEFALSVAGGDSLLQKPHEQLWVQRINPILTAQLEDVLDPGGMRRQCCLRSVIAPLGDHLRGGLHRVGQKGGQRDHRGGVALDGKAFGLADGGAMQEAEGRAVVRRQNTAVERRRTADIRSNKSRISAEAEEQGRWIEKEMIEAIRLDVPLKVDISYGPSWLADK